MTFAPAFVGMVALYLTLGVADSSACDRDTSPLETPAVGVAVADIVVVAEVTRVGGGTSTVRITEALKGGGKGTSQGDRIQVRRTISAEEATKEDFCGTVPMAVGKKYILMLWNPLPASAEFDLVDPVGGVNEYSPAQHAAIKDALAKQHPHSAWKTSQPGVQAQLVLDPEPDTAKKEVNLLVLLRNTGSTAIDYQYKSWPPEFQSKCTLSIVNVATKQKVDAKDVPIAKKDIADYFSKHDKKYEVKLKPGDSYYLRLQRVTTAESGWGYKEELGFRYYPIAANGLHSVSATCTNLFGPKTQTPTGVLDVIL